MVGICGRPDATKSQHLERQVFKAWNVGMMSGGISSESLLITVSVEPGGSLQMKAMRIPLSPLAAWYGAQSVMIFEENHVK